MAEKIKSAIIGPGNIGTDLMIKILTKGEHLDVVALVGIDPESDGLARAKRLGVETTFEGYQGLRKLDVYKDIDIIFDATSAKAHESHAKMAKEDNKRMIDLTPAAIGPFIIPPINLGENLDADNVNMVTCGGQATIPIIYAIKRVVDDLIYAEIVASISSKSAGPGTRANIDEFTETTSLAIKKLGGAKHSKAIIVLNPAEPPLMMRDTIMTISTGATREKIEASILEMVESVQQYVPGYRLKQKVLFEDIVTPVNIPGHGPAAGLKTTVMLEVEGAAHYLPSYAGNLDIMTSAAKKTAETLAEKILTTSLGV